MHPSGADTPRAKRTDPTADSGPDSRFGASRRLTCSVVVPVYNGAGVIGRCLDALAAQQPTDPTLEILVVDDGSTDQTAAVVQVWGMAHPSVRLRLASQPNAGPASARNRGARLAAGELLLLTDADCV
ncbi:MAG: glycosyltransferase family 2 protein, partial [Caldilineaceae bacterium]